MELAITSISVGNLPPGFHSIAVIVPRSLSVSVSVSFPFRRTPRVKTEPGFPDDII